MNVVINNKHGGFGISNEAAEWLIENKGWEVTQWDDGTYADPEADLVDVTAGPEGRDYREQQKYSFVGGRRDPELRSDPDLIECVETLGDDADGRHASLKIVEVPDGVEWQIEEYDGAEWIAEEHRTWK